MFVREVCSRDVHMLSRSDTVRTAAMRMSEHHVGTLVVVDGRRRPEGIVTDRDIVIRCVAREFDPASTPVVEIMTSPVETLPEDSTIDAAVERMAKTQIRRLIVTDARGHMVGILALDDALASLVRQATDIGRLLESQTPV
jgi:CBS domain-containing protein